MPSALIYRYAHAHVPYILRGRKVFASMRQRALRNTAELLSGHRKEANRRKRSIKPSITRDETGRSRRSCGTGFGTRHLGAKNDKS